MKYKFFLLTFLFISFLFALVPEHNPDLDYKCTIGFGWSRGTVACEQVNCPPGSGRTYTYECNCGEAWNQPFTTCYDPDGTGLATHCIPRGQSCKDAVVGYDVITGGCKSGFEQTNEGNCEPRFPDKISCKLVDIEGNRLSGIEVTVGEYGANPTAAVSSSVYTTNAEGELVANVLNRSSASINFIFRGNNEYYLANHKMFVEKQNECVITAYTNKQVEDYIKKEYTELFKNACVPQEVIDKINAATFEFSANVATSQYDPENKKMLISEGDMKGGWETLRRSLLHEFGHYVSDSVLDPSSFYVKGVPFFGKYVGGEHNTWAPSGDGWVIDGQETAFEEGFADFFAVLYFASKGEQYDPDFETDTKALQVLTSEGITKGVRTEGVITSFLYEYYKDQIKENPSHALGDFVRSMTYDKRNNFFGGTPARTVQDWVVQNAKSKNHETPSECTYTNAPDIVPLARKYGFDSDGLYKLKVNKIRETDDTRPFIGDQPPDLSPHNILLNLATPYKLPQESGQVTLESYPEDFTTTGTVRRITFSEGTNEFRIDPDNTVVIINGSAHVLDASVRTQRIRIDHMETEFMVSVSENSDEVIVLDGSVEVVDNQSRTITLQKYQKVSHDGTTFSEVQSVDQNSIKPFWVSSSGGSSSTSPAQGPQCPLTFLLLSLTGYILLRD